MRRLEEIEISKWLNADETYKLAAGKVVAIHAFQMLCPGCILHGIPQSQRLHANFSEEHVSVIGLHTVFEHHEAMREVSLTAFLQEFRIRFPVGIDKPTEFAIPKTMRKFELQGTPSWLIFDRKGELKIQKFGQFDDILLGAEIARLALEGIPLNTNIYKKQK